MTNIFPDCMMPDGAEPCKGYQQMQVENERLRAMQQGYRKEASQLRIENANLRAALADPKP
jgi:hypothetical protein